MIDSHKLPLWHKPMSALQGRHSLKLVLANGLTTWLLSHLVCADESLLPFIFLLTFEYRQFTQGLGKITVPSWLHSFLTVIIVFIDSYWQGIIVTVNVQPKRLFIPQNR